LRLDVAFELYFMTEDPLYRRDLLRLAADAKGAGHLSAPDATATRHNPACGDRVTVELALEGGRIADLGHTTQACILTQASAALLTTAAVGRNRDSLADLAAGVRDFLRDAGPDDQLGGYEVFHGLKEHAGRHVCVLLPLEAALLAFEQAEPGRERAQD
jgi:NifU-like protein involved in Fe-S cluster formation